MHVKFTQFVLLAMSASPSFLTSMTWAREPCSRVVTETDAAVQRNFPNLASRVDSALSAGGSMDTCAHVQLSSLGPRIRVTVTLEDGRQAVRTLEGDGDVVPVVQALLLVPDSNETADVDPDPEANPMPEDPSTGSPLVLAAPQSLTTNSSRDPSPSRSEARLDASTRMQPSTGSHLELAFGTTAQSGDGQSSLGVILVPRIERWQWVFGLGVKVESAVLTTSPYSTGRLGALIGRRFAFESAALDVFAEPALATHIGSYTYTDRVDPESPPTPEAENPLVIPRFVLGGQLQFNRRSALRPFVGLYGELGSTGDAGQDLLGALPALPRWGVGLSLGGVVAP